MTRSLVFIVNALFLNHGLILGEKVCQNCTRSFDGMLECGFLSEYSSRIAPLS